MRVSVGLLVICSFSLYDFLTLLLLLSHLPIISFPFSLSDQQNLLHTNTMTALTKNQMLILYIASFISFGLTLGGTPVTAAPYILYVSQIILFQYSPKLRDTFLVSTLLAAVAVCCIMGPSLPLKGPAIPILCCYIGCQLTFPTLLATVVKRRLKVNGESPYYHFIMPVFATAVEYVHARIFPYGSVSILKLRRTKGVAYLFFFRDV